jgi:predicted dehydrogenase
VTLKIGLIGLGKMGQNHARIIKHSPKVESFLIHDLDPFALDKSSIQFNAKIAKSIQELESCDGVVIAAGTPAHYDLANALLDMDIPLLIEKPLCERYSECEALVERSRKLSVPIMCGFVERFNPAILSALNILDGPVRHLHSYRHSPKNDRDISDVVTDLLIHDLDITARIAPPGIVPLIHSTNLKPVGRHYVETSDALLQFGQEMTAVQSASRWSQRKIREIRISTDDLLVEVDLLRVTLTVYRHRSQSGGLTDPASYRSETLIEVPFVRHTGEPLASQFDHFLGLVSGERDVEAERESILLPHLWAEMIR